LNLVCFTWTSKQHQCCITSRLAVHLYATLTICFSPPPSRV
jgi:hypothetical protein